LITTATRKEFALVGLGAMGIPLDRADWSGS
jgi:hypothetical protein